jgi:hypothetical protein
MPELFANFEVNRQPRWPVILRLLSGSLVVHLTLAVSVIYVPAMRDAFSIAAMAGLARYTEKAYTKTVIGQDINMVQIGDKFHYPDGYFAAGVLATGAPVPTPDPFAPRIISEAKSATAGNAASPSPSPSPGASPSSAAFGGDASASPTAAKSLETKSPDDASKELERVAVENNVLVPDEDEINKLPLKDWLANANGKREKGQLDLDALVEITIEAKLNANCKLSDPKVVQKSGDPRMIEVATDLASAISDSNMLSFLKDPAKHKAEMNPPCEAGPLRLTVKLDQSKVSASVASQADSTERATQLATAYNWMLGIGAATAKTKHKDDESAIFQNTKVRSDGKQVIVDFNMPRQTAGELLKKQVEAKPAS